MDWVFREVVSNTGGEWAHRIRAINKKSMGLAAWVHFFNVWRLLLTEVKCRRLSFVSFYFSFFFWTWKIIFFLNHFCFIFWFRNKYFEEGIELLVFK